MKFMEALKIKNKETENGMSTNSTSLNNCLDLFFRSGAMRKSSPIEITNLATKAFAEDPARAIKILFWARDIRGGAGERRFFRISIRHLSNLFPNKMTNVLPLIPEYGRWDDLVNLEGTKVERQVFHIIEGALLNRDALCAKWLPRKGAFANSLRRYLGWSPKQYRKTLVELTKVVETQMCAKEFNKIDYSKVPSLAMSRYGNAFRRNDEERFGEYVQALSDNKDGVKVNTSAIYPYDVIKGMRRGNEVSQAQWDNLPNYMEENNERVLPLVDVSGSMDSSCGGNLTCLDVALSLGLYISERNIGPYKDHFITFSASPELQHLQGDLKERLDQLVTANWDMNTNLEAAFNLILDQAVKHNISQEEMPTQLLILSDMEFDQATDSYNSEWNITAQEMVAEKYTKAGYKMPNIVYWNIQSRGSNIPVKFDESGTALVSGFSPSILKSILSGSNMNPLDIMDNTIFNERYDKIILEK